MGKFMKTLSIFTLAAALALTGCATAGGQQTAVQRAMGQCVATVGLGAIAGAVIGNNTGSGNAQQGATIGALAGAGVCGFLLYRASEADKARIRQLEIAALNQPEPGVYGEQFTAENGTDQIFVETVVSDVPEEELPDHVVIASAESDAMFPADGTDAAEGESVADAAVTAEGPTYNKCRYSTQSISTGGRTMKGGKVLTCRTQLGDWVTP
jgi:hypothetical protein